jgi:hypothetical protein
MVIFEQNYHQDHILREGEPAVTRRDYVITAWLIKRNSEHDFSWSVPVTSGGCGETEGQYHAIVFADGTMITTDADGSEETTTVQFLTIAAKTRA